MKRNDWIIIGVGLAVAIMIYGAMALINESANATELGVEVYLDGELKEYIALEKYGSYRYDHEYGYNIIEVNEQGVHVLEADCPTQSCTRHTAIMRPRENIVCLPYRFHVVIVGKENEEVIIDAISK